MRTTLLLIVPMLGLAPMPSPTIGASSHQEATVASPYCDGWKEGWKEGWKYVKGEYSIPPIAPVCPVPEVGRNEYRDGYNRGFVAGSEKARKP